MADKPSMNLIAKNASLLTFRMILATAVGLFTSRIVLQALGVEDYGIYGVVGGIVTLIGFLQNTLSGSTSRFLAYEIGRGNTEVLQGVFSTARSLHLVLAIMVIIIGEVAGVPFLNYCLDIPPDRLYAAGWVLQFSIFQIAVSISQTPCLALIQANEKMHVYAVAEIINVCLRLGVAYLLLIAQTDKLILYGALNLAITILLQGFYTIYCLKFSGIGFALSISKTHASKLLQFSILDLYQSLCSTAALQMMNFIINIFFGVICNAAVGLAIVINGAVIGLATTSWQAFRPQIIKQYSAGEVSTLEKLLQTASRFSVAAMLAMIIPCIFEADYVLQLWLGEVPPHAVSFLRIILLMGFFNNLSYQISTPVQASGRIKILSLANGTILICSPAVAWLTLRESTNETTPYIIMCIAYMMCCINGLFCIRREIPSLKISNYIRTIAAVIICSSVAAAIIGIILHYWTEASFLRLIATVTVFLAIFTTLLYRFCLTAENRIYIKQLIKWL